MLRRFPLRWAAMCVFTLSTALGFLDRQILAAMAPEVRVEFGLSNQDYGYLLAVFSVTYAMSAPLMGLLIDRIGLLRGASLAVGCWSAAGMATGLAGRFVTLMGCRAALGVTQSANIPASGKAWALYLRPGERALGSALNQIGISVGLVGAPLVAAWLAPLYGWRSVFFFTGGVGFLWIPLWVWVTSRVPPAEITAETKAPSVADMLRDRRLWTLMAANVLTMTIYSLWSNWTTVFLVEVHGLEQSLANRHFAWIPPVFAAAGGLAGGWLSMRLHRAGTELQRARRLVCWLGATALLATAAAPLLSSATLGTAVIAWSFFWTVAFSVNLYALPLDIYGPARAAFGVSSLTAAYGLMQTVISPAVGALIDRHGFEPVCLLLAGLPLVAAAILSTTGKRS